MSARAAETGRTPEVLIRVNVAGIGLDATSLHDYISGGTPGNGTLYREDQ